MKMKSKQISNNDLFREFTPLVKTDSQIGTLLVSKQDGQGHIKLFQAFFYFCST